MAFISVMDIKVELDMKPTDIEDNYWLNELVTSVLSFWDDLSEMTWASTEQTEYHSADGYTDRIFVNHRPIASIDSVYDDPDRDYESTDLIDSDDYTYDEEKGIVFFDYNLMKGLNNIRIIYTAGYSDSAVPAWLKRLLIRQVAHWYQQGKEKRWDLSSKALPAGAGSVNYNTLRENLLPEFVQAAERHKR